MNNIGYCCINVSLNENTPNKDKISVNRGMVKRTFETKGLEYVSELALKNIYDFRKILEWNLKNKIFVYRMSSDMFPCLGFYKIKDLPNYEKISQNLKECGKFSMENSIRLSFHPSHFCILASEKETVVENAIDELNKHAEIMDIMGLEQSTLYPINIHVGTTKPSLELASVKFCNNFLRLSESCKKRLTIENDDSVNQFSVKMLYDLVHKAIGIPIVFDQHHFNYGPKDQSMEEALKLSLSTWKTKPLTHMSSSRKLEDINSVVTAHADYIYEKIETFGFEFDIEIEAKAKDLAVLKYFKDFNIL